MDNSHIKIYENYINGKFYTSEIIREIKPPWLNEPAGAVCVATPEQIEIAVNSACSAFKIAHELPAWRRTEVIEKIIHSLKSEKESIAKLIAIECGKPIKLAKVEVDRAILTFTEALEECKRIRGEWIPLDCDVSNTGRSALVKRFPLGPVLGISPFNFPLNLVAHKIAPALACGTSIVLKPSPQAPLSALNLAKIIHNAQCLAGMVNVVFCDNTDAEKMVCDERFKILTFTGSAEVGWKLKQKAGKKKVVLELGGNAAAIVHGDAEIGHAAFRCASGAFVFAGQICISLQRIFVQRSVFDEFLEKFITATKNLVVGDILDEQTDIGPMISPVAAQRAAQIVDEAIACGAKIIHGGDVSGIWMKPTVLTNTSPQMRIWQEEIFAPVAIVENYEDFNSAIEMVNNTCYGLQAGVFTKNINLALNAFKKLEVGGVILNDVPTYRSDIMPYGGWKDSGTGREGVRYAIEEYTERRVLVLKE